MRETGPKRKSRRKVSQKSENFNIVASKFLIMGQFLSIFELYPTGTFYLLARVVA